MDLDLSVAGVILCAFMRDGVATGGFIFITLLQGLGRNKSWPAVMAHIAYCKYQIWQ